MEQAAFACPAEISSPVSFTHDLWASFLQAVLLERDLALKPEKRHGVGMVADY